MIPEHTELLASIKRRDGRNVRHWLYVLLERHINRLPDDLKPGDVREVIDCLGMDVGHLEGLVRNG